MVVKYLGKVEVGVATKSVSPYRPAYNLVVLDQRRRSLATKAVSSRRGDAQIPHRPTYLEMNRQLLAIISKKEQYVTARITGLV